MDKQKEWLIELVHDAICKYDEFIEECHKEDGVPLTDDFEYIADYLLANGVLVPPCKVGDTVYYIGGIHHTLVKKATILEIIMNCNGISDLYVEGEGANFENGFNEFFLTREEAEAALNERQEKE